MSHFCTVVLCKDPADIKMLLAPFQENNMEDCPKQYLQFFEDEDCGIDEETGKHGYWENPNAKWNYWVLGGRFKRCFKTKEGQFVTCAQLRDLDFTPTPAQIERYEREWDVAVDGAEMRETDDFYIYRKKEYYVDTWGTKDKFVAEMCNSAPWAFITPDGVWHEKGTMGWWGMHDATGDSRAVFIRDWEKALSEIPDDFYAVVLDCHI